MSLIVVLAPFVGNLGQDVVRLLVLVFGIADHHLDHRWLKLRQRPDTRAKLLQTRGTVSILDKEIDMNMRQTENRVR